MGGAADRTAISPPMTVICSNVDSATVALPPRMQMSEVLSVTGVVRMEDTGVMAIDASVMLPEETRMNCDDGSVSVAGGKEKMIRLILTNEPETVKSGSDDASH